MRLSASLFLPFYLIFLRTLPIQMASSQSQDMLDLDVTGMSPLHDPSDASETWQDPP